MRRRGRRGGGGRFSGSRSDGFDDVLLNFELFPLDTEGNEVVSETTTTQLFAIDNGGVTVNEVANYTFSDVIENFFGTFTAEENGDPSDDFIFAPEGEPKNITAPNLDLTARYLPAGSILTLIDGTPVVSTFDINGDGILNDAITTDEDRLEFVITGTALETEGVSEIAFAIDNADELRLGSETFDAAPVLQIQGQQDEIFSSGINIDVDNDGIIERANFQAEFVRVDGEFYQIFEGNTVDGEGEFVVVPNDRGEETVFTLQGEFGNETLVGSFTSIESQGRFIQASIFEGNTFDREEFLEIEGDFLDIDGETVEIQGDAGEEFVEFRGETVPLNSEFGSGFFSVGISEIEVGGELILDTPEEIAAATTDLELITELIGSSTAIRFSGGSATDPDLIVSQESPPAFIDTPILIEAEDLNLDTYLVEDRPTGEQFISLQRATGNIGTATLDLNSEDTLVTAGTYDLTLSVFDENDGEAQLEVLLNDSIVGEPILLDEETTSSFPVEGVRREIVIEDIEIGSSDTITIRGTADRSEWARVDFISFSPSIAEDDPIAVPDADESI